MRTKRFLWAGAEATATLLRDFAAQARGEVSTAAVSEMGTEIFSQGDAALLRLIERHDGIRLAPEQLRIAPEEAEAALRSLDSGLRGALELAAGNIRAVAEAQQGAPPVSVSLPQGQTVTVREVPVQAAGIYAPGGRATYPSSVLMCAIPAQVAGVERRVLVSPPGENGRPAASVLAAAALCGIDEIYAVGGAQAIFALAFGTETIPRVNVVVGPGNLWVQEAKRRAFGEVGIDSYAGPSELMVIAGHDSDPEWIAFDLCAQAEHGAESPLVAVAVEDHVLAAIEASVERLAASRGTVTEAPLALVAVPDAEAAVELANAYAPEHLELAEGDADLLAERVRTAGCVFVGRYGATAFGDYVAGSNHVLPTSGAGAYAGPLGPGTFRRRISTVAVPAGAAEKLAPYADAIARAEGLPVHGESAMIRTSDDE
ncbi:MAG TPA: histidinol dehydrogenase [Solirubrobacterales bacterium]|nr:histidinol dehydrogenase [Solirubrobacterales bacterium]